MDIGKNIKTIREIKEITQQYMAKKLGVAVSTYNGFENGKNKIEFGCILEIAQILKVDYQQILSLSPSQIFNNNNNSQYANTVNHQNNYANEELIKQLQTKDTQIEKLLSLLAEKK